MMVAQRGKNNVPFLPGTALAKDQAPKGKPTDNIKTKHGKSGVAKTRKDYNHYFNGYPGGKARTTDRMKRAAARRLGM